MGGIIRLTDRERERDSRLTGIIETNMALSQVAVHGYWMRPTLGNYFEVGVGSKIFFKK